MPEDKRIRKTKKLLKDAMLALLRSKPLEQISVKELCAASDTSRITFYSHYSDKYDLADSIFEDIIAKATDDYHRMQETNNPGGDPVTSYCNMLDCILDLYYNNMSMLTHAPMDANVYVNYKFAQYVTKYVEHRIEKESSLLVPKYSLSRTAQFIIYGMWGFITAAHDEGAPIESLRIEARELLGRLLSSDIITRTAENASLLR